jgi:hypothetical protein
MCRPVSNDAAQRGRRALSSKSTFNSRGPQTKKSRVPPRRNKQDFVSAASPPPVIDTAAFFLVGTKVKHAAHGSGKVVMPSVGQDVLVISFLKYFDTSSWSIILCRSLVQALLLHLFFIIPLRPKYKF